MNNNTQSRRHLANLFYKSALWESECRAFFKEGQLYQIRKNRGLALVSHPQSLIYKNIVMFVSWDKTMSFPVAVFITPFGEIKKATLAVQVSPREYMRTLRSPEDYEEGI